MERSNVSIIHQNHYVDGNALQLEKSKLQTALSVFSSSSAKWVFLNVANKEMTFFTFTHTKPTEIMGHEIYIYKQKALFGFFSNGKKVFLSHKGKHCLATMAKLSLDFQWKTSLDYNGNRKTFNGNTFFRFSMENHLLFSH